jgi:hypothetical protein
MTLVSCVCATSGNNFIMTIRPQMRSSVAVGSSANSSFGVSTPATAWGEKFSVFCSVGVVFLRRSWRPLVWQHLAILRFAVQVRQSCHYITQVFALIVSVPMRTAQYRVQGACRLAAPLVSEKQPIPHCLQNPAERLFPPIRQAHFAVGTVGKNYLHALETVAACLKYALCPVVILDVGGM